MTTARGWPTGAHVGPRGALTTGVATEATRT